MKIRTVASLCRSTAVLEIQPALVLQSATRAQGETSGKTDFKTQRQSCLSTW